MVVIVVARSVCPRIKTVRVAKDHEITANDRGVPLSGRIYVVPIARKMAGARPWIFLRVIVAQ